MTTPQNFDRSKLKEKVVNEGVLMHRLFYTLQMERYRFSQEVFEKRLADLPIPRLNTKNLSSFGE